MLSIARSSRRSCSIGTMPALHLLQARHQQSINCCRKRAIESDYPHSDRRRPYTWGNLDHGLEDVPEDDASKVVDLNARPIQRFPRA
jgi:hypothetical protein